MRYNVELFLNSVVKVLLGFSMYCSNWVRFACVCSTAQMHIDEPDTTEHSICSFDTIDANFISEIMQ